MAIINSIAFGKARGKIGNVIFQSYFKKTIARQKNTSISKPPTSSQLIQQRKFKVTCQAWNYCGHIYQTISKEAKSGETMFNWFIKNFNYAASHSVYDNDRLAFNSFSQRVYLQSSKINIYSVETVNVVPHSGETLIKFSNLGIFADDDIILNLFVYDSVNDESLVLVRNLTFEEIEAGQVYIQPLEDINEVPTVFFSDSSKYLISNININRAQINP